MKPVYLRELRNRYRSELSQAYPLVEADSIFYMLIAHFFQFPRTILAMEPEKRLPEAEASLLLNALSELKAHRPVQHIIGHAYFMDMQLRVSPDVLIPRPETEDLVRWVVSGFPEATANWSVLDIGTGSGCIALGIKKYLPESEVFGMDISDGALEVARSNAATQNLDIHFFEADLRESVSHLSEFDVLVSNPPYVPEREMAGMQRHVSASEPHLALFVPDKDPLLYYRYLCHFAARHLKEGGWMYVETHENHAGAVGALFEGRGFSSVEVKKDIFDKNRFVRGRKETSVNSAGTSQL